MPLLDRGPVKTGRTFLISYGPVIVRLVPPCTYPSSGPFPTLPNYSDDKFPVHCVPFPGIGASGFRDNSGLALSFSLFRLRLWGWSSRKRGRACAAGVQGFMCHHDNRSGMQQHRNPYAIVIHTYQHEQSHL